jgi:hypothetical protein
VGSGKRLSLNLSLEAVGIILEVREGRAGRVRGLVKGRHRGGLQGEGEGSAKPREGTLKYRGEGRPGDLWQLPVYSPDAECRGIHKRIPRSLSEKGSQARLSRLSIYEEVP